MSSSTFQTVRSARVRTAGALMKHADVAAVGLEMGGSVAAGFLIGSWVDGELGTGPWGLAFFLVCGFGSAAKAVVRVIRRWKQQIDADKRAEVALHGDAP